MSPGFQKPGAPSYASRLRGEPPPYMGRSGGNPPPLLPSASQNKSYNNLSMPNNAGKHLQGTPSNLGPRSQDHAWTQKSVVADPRVPKKSPFDGASATPSNLGPRSQARAGTQKSVVADPRIPKKSPFDEASTATSQCTSQPKHTITRGAPTISLDQKGMAESMAKLSIDSSQKSGSVVIGRCLNWERPTPSISSKVSKCLPRSDKSYSKPPAGEYSISYKRKPNQGPMDQAGYREYTPFLKEDFKIGTIVRRNVHEPDYMGPAVPAFAPGSQASQTSTLVGKGGKGFREHRSMGDFGPIYSEDRYFIVVSLCKTTYYAIPCYTHDKKGLANIADKEDWISVQDHRNLNSCQQQSEHVPLLTKIMAPEAKILNPLTAAWLPYAIPVRYSVPVAYQGRLDQQSAQRVRSLFLEYLGDET
ncbi:hypothetical protein IMSHALPRED_011105 [Imshaugia aleurites]|uniref:Uncharacterized protein n=1 Tax=Imshaugia aleurites TaxID=172621 RepID=A0A8H3G5W0_9LECA|nr:hypothetical protein IMSHALPRED_011105 [Imshaugia aleurites]